MTIKFTNKRIKPLSQITASDVPRGLDAEDVATVDDLSAKKNLEVLLYHDNRSSYGERAEKILEDAKIGYTTVPTSGGIPEVNIGSSRYVGIKEIREFVKGYNEGTLPAFNGYKLG